VICITSYVSVRESLGVCSPDCSNGDVGDAAAGEACAGCAGTVGDSTC
jgi:hypothetical protein